MDRGKAGRHEQLENNSKIASATSEVPEKDRHSLPDSKTADLEKGFLNAAGREKETTTAVQTAAQRLSTPDDWQNLARNVNKQAREGQHMSVASQQDGKIIVTVQGKEYATTYNVTLGHELNADTGRVEGAVVEKVTPSSVGYGKSETGDRHATLSGAKSEKELLTLQAPSKPLDPSRPTVMYVDDFAHPEITLDRAHHGPSHGEVSARPAEALGQYNVLRAQVNPGMLPSTRLGLSNSMHDFSSVFEDINKKIENGTLPLNSGDVISVSLGNNAARKADGTPVLDGKSGEPTFEQLNDNLGSGFKVTPENLKEMRPKILERLKEIANTDDPTESFLTGVWARAVVATNEAIDKLQAKGIQVMIAAGNDGPDRVSWNYMNAEKQLAAVDSKGQYISWSAHNALTEPSLGRFEFKYDSANPGTYRLEGTKAIFSAKELGIQQAPDRCHFRIPTNDFLLNTIPFRRGQNNCMIAVADGTSYANIRALEAEYQERKAMKSAGK